MTEIIASIDVTDIEWLPVQVNYKAEKRRIALSKSSVAIHPLLPTPKRNKKQELPAINGGIGANKGAVGRESIPIDPLGSPLMGFDPLMGSFSGSFRGDPLRSPSKGSDPLSSLSSSQLIGEDTKNVPRARNSQNVAKNIKNSKNVPQSSQSMLRDVPNRSAARSPWQMKKEQIVSECTNILNINTDNTGKTGNRQQTENKYNSYDRNDIQSSSSQADKNGNDKNGNQDKYGLRLASLEKRNTQPSKCIGSNQKKIEAAIAQLSAELTAAWSNNEKIKSFEIAVQLAGVLKDMKDLDTSTLYPIKFVLITDELERFGCMVFGRMEDKADNDRHTSVETPSEAEEKSRNWLRKIQCVPDILTRTYLQISLLRCYQYLPDNNYPRVLAQLSDTLASLTDLNNEKIEKNNNRNDSKGSTGNNGNNGNNGNSSNVGNGRNGSNSNNSNNSNNEKNSEIGIIIMYARAYLAAMSVSVCPCSLHYWDLARESMGWFRVPVGEDNQQSNGLTHRLMLPAAEWLITHVGALSVRIDNMSRDQIFDMNHINNERHDSSNNNKNNSNSNCDHDHDDDSSSNHNNNTNYYSNSNIHCGRDLFTLILEKYKENCNNILILKLIISSFSGLCYPDQVMGLVRLVSEGNSGHNSNSNNSDYSSNGNTGNGNSDNNNGRRNSSGSSSSSSTSSSGSANDNNSSSNNNPRTTLANLRTDTLAALGKQLASHPPPDTQRRPLLREVWKMVSCTDSLISYVRCASSWLLFTKIHCSEKEVLILLSDLAAKLQSYGATGRLDSEEDTDLVVGSPTLTLFDIPESVQSHIAVVLEGLLSLGEIGGDGNNVIVARSNITDENNENNENNGSNGSNGNNNTNGVDGSKDNNSNSNTSSINQSTLTHNMRMWTAVITSPRFQETLDLLKRSKKILICQEALEGVHRSPRSEDAVLLNSLFDIGQCVHDGIDSLSSEGDRKHSASLLCAFIDKIDCGKDLEKQLDFYCECRSRFRNMEEVKEKLVLCVLSLVGKALQIMKGKHNKKTSAFVKSAFAYCHITVPSVSDLFKRLNLLLYCAESAVCNSCLPQTDTFLKAAISILPDLPNYEEVTGSDSGGKRVSTEERTASSVRCLLSLLVVTPGHPTLGPFFLLKGLMAALKKISWHPSSGVQTRLYVDMYVLLCTLSQNVLPYRVPGVVSNDELYGGSVEYKTELYELLSVCIADMSEQLASLKEPEQSKCAFLFFSQITGRVVVTPRVASFFRWILDLIPERKGRERGVFCCAVSALLVEVESVISGREDGVGRESGVGDGRDGSEGKEEDASLQGLCDALKSRLRTV